MKRVLVLGGAILMSVVLAGCSSETHEGLVSTTIEMIDINATQIGVIKARVKEATKASQESRKKLNFAEAIEATKKLKENGDEAQKLRKRIEAVRSQISEDDKKANAESKKDKLNRAMSDLLKQRQELRDALEEAAALTTPSAALLVKELREKIVEAESPFEALAR